ncbi:MAG: hypothetical protein AAF762_00805, partial [Pseudomonadota bacterium]
MNKTPLKYPNIRLELKEYLSTIVEENDNYTKKIQINIGFIVNFFFDDTELASDPSSYIGIALHDCREASALVQFGEAFDAYLDAASPGDSPLEFKDGPEWR